MTIVRLGVLLGVLLVASPAPIASSEPSPCAQQSATIRPARPMAHRDCRLRSTDQVGLMFDVTYWTPSPDISPLSVRIVVRSGLGAQIEVINELLEVSSPAPVGLVDIDGDRRDEIVIPIAERTINGAVNTRFSVWRAPSESTHFERTQMIGQAVYSSGDGYVVGNSGGITSRDLDFYLPTAAGYTQIVTITIAAEDIDFATHSVRTVSCVAHRQSGLGAIDMDYRDSPSFCESPAARSIWPDALRI